MSETDRDTEMGPDSRGADESPDALDTLLRTSLTSPGPSLSTSFDAQLLRQTTARTPGTAGRRILWCYAVLAPLTCVAAMRSVGLDWSLIGSSILLTAAIGLAATQRIR